MQFLVSLAHLWMLTGLGVAQFTTNSTYLTATAIVTKNNYSAFECWQLTEPFRQSSVAGISGTPIVTISNNTNLAYSIIPARFNGGLHNAPAPQIVHFLSGLAFVSLPHNDTKLYIVGGVGGFLFAVDTTGTVHVTEYPSDEETVAFAAPFAEGKIPNHRVLFDGPCAGSSTFT